jgi:hypothetical protein
MSDNGVIAEKRSRGRPAKAVDVCFNNFNYYMNVI